MATDTKVQRPWEADLGGPTNPATPNGALLESAGQYAGKAAELEGQGNAAAITFWGGMANEAVIGYQQAKLDKAVNSIIENTYNPETGLIGQQAREKQNLELGTEKSTWDATFNQAFNDTTDQGRNNPELRATLDASENKMKRIMAGQVDGIFSPTQARTMIAAHVKEAIAAMPGLGEQFRQQAQALTGMHGLEVADTKSLLTTDNERAKAAARQKQEYIDNMVKEATALGLGAKYGVPNYIDIASHIEQRTDIGTRMATDIQLHNLTKTLQAERTALAASGKLASKEQLDEYVGKGIVSIATIGISERNKFATELEGKGIKLDTLTPAQLTNNPQLEQELRTMQARIVNQKRAQINSALTGLDASFQASGGKIKPEDYMAARKQYEELLESINKVDPINGSIETILEQTKRYSVSAGQNLDNLVKIGQAEEYMLKNAFGPDFLNMSKTPQAMKTLRETWKGNPSVLGLLDAIEANQKGVGGQLEKINRFRTVQTIANGLSKPDATQAEKDAAKNASPQEIADARGLVKSHAQDVRKAGGAYTDNDANSYLGYGQVYNGTGTELDHMYRDITTGKHKDVLKKYPQQVAAFEKGVGERTNQLLLGTGSTSILSRLGGEKYLKSAGVVIVNTREGGDVVLGVESIKGVPTDTPSANVVRGIIDDANKLLKIQKALGVNPNTAAELIISGVQRPAAVKVGKITTAVEPTGTTLAVNNPLGLKDTDQKTRKFDSIEDAFKASASQIDLYVTGKSTMAGGKPMNKVGDILQTWVGKVQGAMEPSKYAKIVEEHTGLSPTDTITAANIPLLMYGMQFAEQGKEVMPFSKIAKAVRGS